MIDEIFFRKTDVQNSKINKSEGALCSTLILFLLTELRAKECTLNWLEIILDLIFLSFNRLDTPNTVLLPILDNPTQLAIAIYEEMHTNLIQNLYIAAPPNENVFVRKLTKILSSKGVQVVNSDQAQLFMKGHYPNCDHFKVEFCDLTCD